jgi:hypothetical protein
MGETTAVTLVNARAVHLLPAGELFEQGYPNIPVAICGEPVTSGPDSSEGDPSYCPDCYCPDCVSTALRWNTRPEVVS